MIKKWWELILLLILMVLIGLMIMTVMGCALDPPIKDESENKKCFQFRQCMYIIQKSKDKSPCMKFLDECSKLDTYEYCKDKHNRIPIKVKTRQGLVEGDDFFVGCYEILK